MTYQEAKLTFKQATGDSLKVKRDLWKVWAKSEARPRPARWATAPAAPTTVQPSQARLAARPG